MVEFISIDDIKPHPNNPKKHPPEQLDMIAEVIKAVGWGRAALLSKDNYTLAGHGAIKAAVTRLGYKEIPCTRSPHMHDTPEALQIMLADNKLGEYNQWDFPQLEVIFTELQTKDINLELTGFKIAEIDSLLLNNDFEGEVNLEEGENIPEKPPKKPKEVVCPECGEEFEIE
jgi:hypothetical protein